MGQILALRQPQNQRLIQLRHGGKVKLSECFLPGKMGLPNALFQCVLFSDLDFLVNEQVQKLLVGEIPFGGLAGQLTVLPENIGQAQLLQVRFQ